MVVAVGQAQLVLYSKAPARRQHHHGRRLVRIVGGELDASMVHPVLEVGPLGALEHEVPAEQVGGRRVRCEVGHGVLQRDAQVRLA